MIHNKKNFLSIVLMFIIYSSYTYGEIWNNKIEVPGNNVFNTCKGWMVYHGFEDYEPNNIDMAKRRKKMLDRKAYVYSATYAYFISAFSKECLDVQNYTISGFCQRLQEPNEETLYIALKDAKMTCQKWIISYGYQEEMISLSVEMATNRMKPHDQYMHIWALMYTRHLDMFNDQLLKPSEFCRKLGNGQKKLPFVTIETTMTCEEWIILSEYSNDTNSNMKKALEQDLSFENSLSNSTVDYIKYLRVFNENPPVDDYCCNFLSDIQPNKPGKFCSLTKHGSKVPVHYKEK